MLAMMPVIAEYTFKMFLTFYILQVGPSNVAFKKLTQCVNALKKLTL